MPDTFPNANYPEGYPEANMFNSLDVSVNADGGKLTVTEVAAGSGPLSEHAVTGPDVKGVSLRDGQPAMVPESPTAEDE